MSKIVCDIDIPFIDGKNQFFSRLSLTPFSHRPCRAATENTDTSQPEGEGADGDKSAGTS